MAVILLTLVYMIPVGDIIRNMPESAKVVEQEGVYYPVFSWCTSCVDNFSDSIILGTAAYRGTGTPLFEAMKCHCFWIHDTGPNDSFVAYYLRGVTNQAYGLQYARYWHGYLLFVKPLLTIFDLNGLRIVNGICQTVLSLVLVILMWNKGLKQQIIPYIISLLMISPVANAMCLQFSHCFYAFTISSIMLVMILSKGGNERKVLFLFLYTGILTSFLDLLSYPLISFGIPAIIYLDYNHNDSSIKELFFKFVKAGICWCAGYAIMWFGKWVIGTIVTHESVFETAIGQAHGWTQGKNLWQVYFDNIYDFSRTPVLFIALAYIAVLFVLIIRNHCLEKVDFKIDILPFLVVGLLPFIWYAAIQTHSAVHHFFTYKSLMITAFSGLSMITSIYSKYSQLISPQE